MAKRTPDTKESLRYDARFCYAMRAFPVVRDGVVSNAAHLGYHNRRMAVVAFWHEDRRRYENRYIGWGKAAAVLNSRRPMPWDDCFEQPQ